MKTHTSLRKRGFTLLETVIAIGVLAVLLTGFMIVFAPAAAGIRKAINVQEADRLASTLEQELVTYRKGQTVSGTGTTGFGKAYEWIRESNTEADALLIYQYRGSLSSSRQDETPEPVTTVKDKMVGKDYIVNTMLRRKSDPEFLADLPAVEGSVYFVKCTQLVFENNELKPGPAGTIKDPKGTAGSTTADDYPEAVIAFSADFYTVPSKAAGYFTSGFSKTFNAAKKPVFTRNLAVRR
jgi:prepilin-type N-terminal cleavage/methylation domain-containing protein